MYFIANLQGSVKVETEIENSNDYRKFAELSNLCRKLIAKNEKRYWSEKYNQKNISRRIFKKHFPFYIRKKKYVL